MVSQTWSDYTFWRESRITRQLFSNFTLAWTPFWAPGFGVLCHIGSQALSYSGRLVPISLSCRLTRATRTQCHIVQQLYGRIRQILRSIKETKSIKINSLSAPSWNCLVVWSLSDVTARHSLPPKYIRSRGCWTRSSSFPQLQALPLSWLHFYEGIIAKKHRLRDTVAQKFAFSNVREFDRVSILSRRFMPPHVICMGGACTAHA